MSQACISVPSLQSIASEQLEVIIIGGGPAGSMAALALARRGIRVLLAERARFPRTKVCGCYLNPTAVATLAAAGLGDLPERLGGRPVTQMEWRIGRHAARFRLPGGWAVSRSALDAALVEAAVGCGARFLAETSATRGALDACSRSVVLRRGDETVTIAAAVVIAADGVAGRFLDDEPGFSPRIAASPRIGIGATICESMDFYQPCTIYMACNRHGYLGLLRVEDDLLPAAAAVDPAWLRRIGGPAAAAATLLADAGLPPIAALAEADWKGTTTLTRRRDRYASERLFAIGDAAGYIEPFTGEGIGWALASGAAVADFAAAGVRGWRTAFADAWNLWYRETIRPRQRTCGLLTGLLRRPTLCGIGARLLAAVPGALNAAARSLQTPLRISTASECLLMEVTP